MFRVDPELLTAAIGSIDEAGQKLSGAKDMLESLHQRLQSSATMSQDSDADNRFDSFHDRWKDEFGILTDMMSGFKDAIGSTSEAYTGADDEIATALLTPPEQPADPPPPGSPPTAV
jgi:uncharacterized protein YukE